MKCEFRQQKVEVVVQVVGDGVMEIRILEGQVFSVRATQRRQTVTGNRVMILSLLKIFPVELPFNYEHSLVIPTVEDPSETFYDSELELSQCCHQGIFNVVSGEIFSICQSLGTNHYFLGDKEGISVLWIVSCLNPIPTHKL